MPIPYRFARASRDQVPEAILVMNLPAGNGLMEHDDVVTFLHEYRPPAARYLRRPEPALGRQSGVTTEWDFVEAPSQMLENWVYDYDTLKVSPWTRGAIRSRANWSSR